MCFSHDNWIARSPATEMYPPGHPKSGKRPLGPDSPAV